MDYLLYLIFVGLGNLIALLPFRILYFISDAVYPLIYYVFKYRKKVVFDNLRNSFPEKSDEEITAIAKKFYRHFCDLFFEVIKTFRISSKEYVKRLHYSNPEVMEQLYNENRHVLVIMSHYCNWEWGVSLAMQGKHKFASIYKPLNNKNFDKLMIHLRTRHGGVMVSMKQTARYLAEHIQSGELTLLNFLVDQSPYYKDIQYWTTFLNQDTAVYLGVEKMARKTRQTVVFNKYRKVKRGYYEVEVVKICDDASKLEQHELTEMHTKILESIIKEQPEYWLWTHKRWKNKRVS